MQLKTFVFAATLSLAALSLVAEPYKIRAVQLDLARQTETVDYVKRYSEIVAKAGYNTLVLYLEGRIRTKTFALPVAESYSEDQIREIVGHATRLGLDVVPVVSVLGHAEHFFRHPGHDNLCEERDGARRFPGNGKQTICPSLPEARAFIDAYVGEVAALFPSRNFHAGLDEAFNAGFCKLCAPKTANRRLGPYFTEVVRHTHERLARLGKRMWMWDDFYEFFPEELENLPKDILLCHWQYDGYISRHGARGHFYDRIRADWLEKYRRLGVDALMSIGWGEMGNAQTFNEYARKKGVAGAFTTQWEMSGAFLSANLVAVVASGRLFQDPDNAKGRDFWREAVDELFPSLSLAERDALALLLWGPREGAPISLEAGINNLNPTTARYAAIAALRTLRASKLQPGSGAVPADPLSEAGMLDDIVTANAIRLFAHDFTAAGPLLALPSRTPADIAKGKFLVGRNRAACEEFLKRRAAQQRAWRPGCCPNEVENYPKALVKWCDTVAKMPDKAAADEALCELSLALPDFHGIPWWTIEVRVNGKWQTVAERKSWKPAGRDGANFEQNVLFRIAGEPEALRIRYSGYGSAGLNYIAVETAKGRWVPAAVTKCTGLVRDVQSILVDTYDPVWFGYTDRLDVVLDPKISTLESVVEIALKKE